MKRARRGAARASRGETAPPAHATRSTLTGRDVAIFAGLTFLVRGLFALDRGFWQDDANIYSLAHDALVSHGLFYALAFPMGSATRVLLGTPSVLAALTGFPVAALHVFHVAIWLGIGVAAAELVRTLFPDRPLAAFSAGVLTICASSDFLTTSLVAAEYDLAVLGFVLFLVGALRYLLGAPWCLLAGAIAGILVSVYSVDVAAAPLALAPVLFAIAPGTRRRRLVLFASSGVAILPYAIMFTRFMLSPVSYAAAASLHLEPSRYTIRAAILLLNNVLPWQWPLDRPEFGAPPLRVVPAILWVAVASVCLLLYVARARQLAHVSPRVRAGRRALASLGVLVAMGAASNVAYASVHFSEIFYRTHLLSRVFVSAGLGVAVDTLIRGRRPLVGWALAAVFVGFGAAGAVERQDYFLSSWRDHRRELVSLLEAVPSVRAGASLVLVMPDDPGWHATGADYLARAWIRILYDDTPGLSERTYLWTPGGLSGCKVEESGLRCWMDAEHGCIGAGTCTGHLVRYEDLVLAAFHPLEGRYRLVLSGDPDGPVLPSSAGYAPERLIGPPRPIPWRLLPGPVLARLLPAFRD